MNPFRLTEFNCSQSILEIIGDGQRLMPLAGGAPPTEMGSRLHAFNPTRDLGGTIRDPESAALCHALLWLYHDGIDPAHDICQRYETPAGSYCHAIVHRREPDAWNSKYWFARIGTHPLPDMLRKQAPLQHLHFTTPQDFVEHVEKVRGRGNAGEESAKRLQLLEWQLFFHLCYESAVGLHERQS